MSLITDMLQNDAAGMLAALGEPVTYTPDGGDAIPEIDAIVNRNASQSGVIADCWSVEVLMSDVVNPAHNDSVVIGAKTFTVQESGASRITNDGVWWKIPVVDDERPTYRGKR